MQWGRFDRDGWFHRRGSRLVHRGRTIRGRRLRLWLDAEPRLDRQWSNIRGRRSLRKLDQAAGLKVGKHESVGVLVRHDGIGVVVEKMEGIQVCAIGDSEKVNTIPCNTL